MWSVNKDAIYFPGIEVFFLYFVATEHNRSKTVVVVRAWIEVSEVKTVINRFPSAKWVRSSVYLAYVEEKPNQNDRPAFW